MGEGYDFDEYSYDISCDYVALEQIANDFKALLANQNGGNFIASAGNNVKSAGKWEGQEEFINAFRSAGNSAITIIEKLGKLADRMARVAETMRDADATVNVNV